MLDQEGFGPELACRESRLKEHSDLLEEEQSSLDSRTQSPPEALQWSLRVPEMLVHMNLVIFTAEKTVILPLSDMCPALRCMASHNYALALICSEFSQSDFGTRDLFPFC